MSNKKSRMQSLKLMFIIKYFIIQLLKKKECPKGTYPITFDSAKQNIQE